MRKSLIRYLVGTGSERVDVLLSIARRCHGNGQARSVRLVLRYLERRHGVYIGQSAGIAPSVRFPHPVGIVIGEGVDIGEGCIIFQNVTIGGRRLGDAQLGYYPRLGSNTIVFAGAVIVGDVTIGSNCVIGANAVVTKDVPNNYVAAGVPATLRKKMVN